MRRGKGKVANPPCGVETFLGGLIATVLLFPVANPPCGVETIMLDGIERTINGVANPPCGVETHTNSFHKHQNNIPLLIHRVELKLAVYDENFNEKVKRLLIHRVELKRKRKRVYVKSACNRC